ncbi:MAG: hypothetical protein JST58_14385 [Bacteroidetes bacterium]|nr:hypothetical protein [Bacteroidota bacterium]
MNFLKAKTSWTNAEFIVFKLCVASIYVLIGAYFHQFFHRFYIPVLILFLVMVVWTLYLWLMKMKAIRGL